MANDYEVLTEDPDFKRLVRQEEFILEVTEALVAALEQSGMNQSKLAEKLGCTRGFVSQLFAGGRNLTLRTIADIASALDVKPKFSLCPESEQNHYIVESIAFPWVDQTSPRIVLHPSAYSQADTERQEMFAQSGLTGFMRHISELIGNVQIENVRVVEASARTSISSHDEAPGVLEARIGRNARVTRLPENGVFVVRTDFVFRAHRQDDKKPRTLPNAAIAVSVSFELTYRIPTNMSAPADALSDFAMVNGVFNAWPYFREFVHASLARMGLPPFILPVYRLSQATKEASKHKQTRSRTKVIARTMAAKHA